MSPEKKRMGGLGKLSDFGKTGSSNVATPEVAEPQEKAVAPPVTVDPILFG